MSVLAIFASALLGSAALAAPSMENIKWRRNGPDNCNATMEDGQGGTQGYVANVRFYTDSDCTQATEAYCADAEEVTLNGGSGAYSCEPAVLPPSTPFYAKVVDSPFPDLQLVYTQDQTCPPSGPGAVFATLINNQRCVEFNLGGGAPGLTVFPHGGAAVSKREEGSVEEVQQVAGAPKLRKRDPSCTGFNIESQKPSESRSVQVSNIVDCTNGADSGCMISVSEQRSMSVTTSYSATAGGGIEGVFMASVTFGMDYTDSESTTTMEGFSVAQGQKGYLSAYSAATLFQGTFTGTFLPLSRVSEEMRGTYTNV